MLELQQKLHIFGRSGPIIFGLSGLDIALWDIAGKAAGQPVHKMLGGAKSPRLTCYASLVRYSDPKVVAANVARALGQGFRHIKLHEIEIAATRAAREAAGPGVDIMLDVNCPWSVHEALEMAEKLRPSTCAGWKSRCGRRKTTPRWRRCAPAAALPWPRAKSHHTHAVPASAGSARGRLPQTEPAKMGGISELRKVFALAARHNVAVAPHSFYDGPAFLGGLHVSTAMGGNSLVEWRFFDLESRLYGEAAIPEGGSIAVPQGPGRGFDPDPDVIRRYRAN